MAVKPAETLHPPTDPVPGNASGGHEERGAQAARLRERAAPLRGMRVLLAEDNPLNQLVAQQFLERVGIAVRVVEDGRLAVAALREQPPGEPAVDLVLMDLHMPVMDGLEATRRIHDLPGLAALPVIGMTATVQPQDRARCEEAGMCDQVLKPVDPGQMFDVLLKWAPRRAAPEALASTTAAAPLRALEGFDLAALLERIHGDEPLLWRLLDIFARREAATPAWIAQALARGDLEAARRKVHELKGSAATLGALDLARACESLEAAWRSGVATGESLRALDAALRTALHSVSRARPERHD